MLAGMTKAAAGDVEAANFRSDGGADENQNEQSEDRQSAAIEETKDQRDAAQDFQPRQIKREPDADKPRQHLEIVDIETELDRIQDLDNASVDEDPANDERHDSRNKS